MTVEATAILGLFFWAWSHQFEHLYDKRGGRGALVKGLALSVIAGGWFALAGLRMAGVIR